MEKLKVVVSAPGFMGATNFEKYEDLIEKSMDEGHTVCCLEYLHGIVEDAMGYDITACLNAESVVDFEAQKFKEGIYDVEVVDYDKPCVAYLWNAGGPRCLIVDKGDREGRSSAEHAYRIRTSIL